MVIYCILTGLLVYYIALWLWYRYTDSRTSAGRTDDALLPRNGVSGYTLIGESQYKGGLIGTAQDKSGHLPQAVENDTIFARRKPSAPRRFFSFLPPGRSGLSIFVLQQWVTCYFPTCRIFSLNKEKSKMQLSQPQLKPPMYALQKCQTEHRKSPVQ